MDFQKGIHYSIELEEAVLGSAIMHPQNMGRIYGHVKAEYFHNEIHQHIFKILAKMFTTGYPIDCLTVADFIFRRNKVVMADNISVGWWIAQVTKRVTGETNTHLEFWCEILAEMHFQRELITLTQAGINTDYDSRQMIAEINEKLNSLSKKSIGGDWLDATQLVINLYDHQEEMARTGGMGVQTGFLSIDRINGGFHKGQSIIMASRPSTGKSAFSGQVCLNMAKSGKKVGVISLEMDNVEIAARMAAIDTDIDFNKIYRNLFSDQRERDIFYERVNNSFANLPIFISDKTGVDIYEIRAKAAKLKADNGIDILMIDYIQLVDSVDKKGRNREQEIAEISRGVKIMAKQLEIPVIILAQLNRQVTQRKGEDRYPYLSDLRESGSLEQDADVVMFLHRDYMMGITQDPNGESTENQADILIRKWRNASLAHIKLGFDAPKMRFFETDSIATSSTYNPVNFYDNDIDF
jgi:replicative DNA helicase